MKTIKRYENRKLYDVEEKKYIKLNEIAELIKTGQEVEIIDHASDEDITAATLAQILYEQEKQGHTNLPSEILSKMIQIGNHQITTLRHGLITAIDPVYFDNEVLKRLEILQKEEKINADLFTDLSAWLTEDRTWQEAPPISEKAASASDITEVSEKINNLEKEILELQNLLKK